MDILFTSRIRFKQMNLNCVASIGFVRFTLQINVISIPTSFFSIIQFLFFISSFASFVSSFQVILQWLYRYGRISQRIARFRGTCRVVHANVIRFFAICLAVFFALSSRHLFLRAPRLQRILTVFFLVLSSKSNREYVPLHVPTTQR